MSANHTPNEAETQAFIGKLNQFRGTLGAEEQQMLDALIGAGRKAHEQGDVEVYWMTSGLSGQSTQGYGVTTNIWTGYGDQGAFSNTPQG